jgi:(2Fe-2S) ferredoxin
VEQAHSPPYDKIFYVCVNERPPDQSSCGTRGSVDIARELKARVKSLNTPVRIRVSRALCLGLCQIGPNVAVFPDNIWYHGVKIEDIPEILRKHAAPPT